MKKRLTALVILLVMLLQCACAAMPATDNIISNQDVVKVNEEMNNEIRNITAIEKLSLRGGSWGDMTWRQIMDKRKASSELGEDFIIIKKRKIKTPKKPKHRQKRKRRSKRKFPNRPWKKQTLFPLLSVVPERPTISPLKSLTPKQAMPSSLRPRAVRNTEPSKQQSTKFLLHRSYRLSVL